MARPANEGTRVRKGPPADDPESLGPMDNPEVHEAITLAFQRIAELEQARSATNAEIRAEREGLKTRGLHSDAIKDAHRYMKMTEEQRQGYDLTYAIARKAFDLPIVYTPAEPIEPEGTTKH